MSQDSFETYWDTVVLLATTTSLPYGDILYSKYVWGWKQESMKY